MTAGDPTARLREVRRRAARATLPERVTLTRGRGGLAVAGIALAAFAVLFALIRTNRSAAADLAITMRLQDQRHPWLHRLMHLTSWPGFPPQSRTLPPLIVGALWTLGFRLEALFQLLAWGTGGISFTFKRIMRRARPGPHHPQIRVAVANIGGTSFPSGHVLNYMGVYGFLAYLTHTHVRPARARRLIVTFLTALLALVGPSRIYLGHHWFTDVLASYLLGIIYLIGLTAVYRRVKRWVSGGEGVVSARQLWVTASTVGRGRRGGRRRRRQRRSSPGRSGLRA